MLNIKLDCITSTQHTAKELADYFPEDDIIVQTRLQTGGRGQYDRQWDSKEGGLYISLLLHPKADIQSMGDLSVKTGVIVANTLRQLYDIKTKIKLPNDVLALDNGTFKKISGILIESSLTSDKLNWLVIGIGVNLNNDISKKIAATSVRKITKQKAGMDEFKDKLLKNFLEAYSHWQKAAKKYN